MKTTKKLVAMLMAALMVLSLAACNQTGGNETTGSTETGPASTEPTNTSVGTATVEETVMYENGGIKMVAKELKDIDGGRALSVAITNDTERNVIVACSSVTVNGVTMAEKNLSVTAQSGTTSELTVEIPQNLLDRTGSREVYSISLHGVDLLDAITYQALVENINMSISSNISESQTLAPIEPEGELLFMNGSVYIYSDGIAKDENGDSILTLYVENGYDTGLSGSVNGVSINGVAASFRSNHSVNESSAAYFEINLTEGVEDDANYGDIVSVALNINLSDRGDRNISIRTGEITVKIGE